jgi:hypothetical protein
MQVLNAKVGSVEVGLRRKKLNPAKVLLVQIMHVRNAYGSLYLDYCQSIFEKPQDRFSTPLPPGLKSFLWLIYGYLREPQTCSTGAITYGL